MRVCQLVNLVSSMSDLRPSLQHLRLTSLSGEITISTATPSA